MAGEDAPGVTFHDFSTGGQTGQLIREKDWRATPLGPRESWPRSLNNHLSMIFELPTAAIIFWGPDQIQLYNDGYSVIMGPRHPRYLGSTFRECWPETYETIHPWMQRVLSNGETIAVNRTLVPLTRFGFTEEAYFTFSFSPLRGDDGKIAGILQIVTEVTDAVLGERRARALHELSNQTAQAKTTEDASRLAVEVLGAHADDLPFALIYVVDPADDRRLTLAGSTGLPEGRGPFTQEIDLKQGGRGVSSELSRVVDERKLVRIEDLSARFGITAGDGPNELPTLAVASPIASTDQRSVIGVLVAGISPRLAFDDRHRRFLELVSAQLGTLMAAARAYDDARRRAEALTELDRAKTEFFGNVSHEFRTPLTLILGPLEDALQGSSRTLQGDELEAVHRNALRLLKLVNTLLDFARVEARRMTSSFEPTDLPTLTAGLAGSFQSLLESAGLLLRVDCPPMSDPVYVDRSHWEKIVLNLISNAFKFTFNGEIAIRLHENDGVIHLSVADTGTGIPSEELPKIFERFHRVKGAHGRSFEGTGIGLALVRELVKQHGGSVRAESTFGKGSTFVVSIPRSNALPSNHRASSPPPSAAATDVTPYLVDAAHWQATETKLGVDEATSADEAGSPSETPTSGRSRILVVDDNADMRKYLARVLSTRWNVELAEDGLVALEMVRKQAPDLVLSDVMMPRMDGVALLQALRADPKTSQVPLMLLSARAGEESVVEGLDTGADDYLAKPFTTRELLARVRTHLDLARLRHEWAAELERTNRELEAFSYSVSHDLRAPLRAIDGFASALLADYSGKLDEQGHHYLGRVRSAAQRMGQLIDDLLALSRISRTPVRRENVDLSDIVRAVMSELAGGEPTRSIETRVPPSAIAKADPRLLKVLFENLLGNAWKFTSKKPCARIEVGVERREEETVYFVRDNGAGFSMEDAKRLFTPFQRLHSDAEFEGTGIGLATVHRIVARHAGRVWAEASPGEGATFFFTLGGHK